MEMEEIISAQDAWAEAIVSIGKLKDDKNSYLLVAEKAIHRLYALGEGKILFKPTRAVQIPFRSTREGILSYFIGGKSDFPEDSGFALQPWLSVRFENASIRFETDRAFAMGHYFFQSQNDEPLKVEYTFGYLKVPDQDPKIFLHHSSLPYNAH